jgi:DHA1 family tetracycline resistance protein-like MFS transporter
MTLSQQPGSRSSRQAAFIFVFITVVLDMVALGVTVPVLPKLIIQFKGGDVPAAAIIAGVFATVWAAMQFIFAPLIGAASDRFGRRPIILLSNFGLGLDYIFMALAPTLPWLFIGRVISGITSSSYPTATAYNALASSACWARRSVLVSCWAQPWARCSVTSTCVCRFGWRRD